MFYQASLEPGHATDTSSRPVESNSPPNASGINARHIIPFFQAAGEGNLHGVANRKLRVANEDASVGAQTRCPSAATSGQLPERVERHLGEVFDNGVGLAKMAAMVGIGDGKDLHAGSTGGGDSRRRILDDNAPLG